MGDLDNMGMISQVRTKVRNLVNRVTRPSAVTEAQHAHLKAYPRCVSCGSLQGGQAHHILPYHKYPDLAADPKNFITLCENVGGLECHLHIGHGGGFKTYNPYVVADAYAFRVAVSDPQRRDSILKRAKEVRLVDA